MSKTYGNADPTLTARITSGSLGSTTVSDTLADLTGPLSREAGETVGSYDVALGSGANAGSKAGNYAITFAADNNALTITPAPLIITARDDVRPYSGVPYAGGNGVTFAGFVSGENQGVLDGSLVYRGTSQGAKYAGRYVIEPGGLSAHNYGITFVSGTLDLVGDPQMIGGVSSVLNSPQHVLNSLGDGPDWRAPDERRPWSPTRERSGNAALDDVSNIPLVVRLPGG